MIQVRYGLFETNSSSTHSLFIVTEEEYKKLEKRVLLISNRRNEKFITKDEALRELEDECPDWQEEYDNNWEVAVREEDIARTLEYYIEEENECLDNYEEHFVTPSGDKIVVFGVYGRDD